MREGRCIGLICLSENLTSGLKGTINWLATGFLE